MVDGAGFAFKEVDGRGLPCIDRLLMQAVRASYECPHLRNRDMGTRFSGEVR